MLIALPLAFVGLVLIRSAFAPEPDPRIVLRDLFAGRGLRIAGGGERAPQPVPISQPIPRVGGRRGSTPPGAATTGLGIDTGVLRLPT